MRTFVSTVLIFVIPIIPQSDVQCGAEIDNGGLKSSDKNFNRNYIGIN